MSPPLATELLDPWADAGEADEVDADVFRLPRVDWQLDGSELEGDWGSPVAVADADLEDDFGGFCGRRVA
jgi:hypothetical protein